MLAQQDILELLAEIAVAIAGFAALAGALVDRAAPASHGITRLRIVVSSGLLLLLSSVAPMIVSDFGFSAETTWRVCSLTAFCMNALIFYQGISRSVGTDLSIRDPSAFLVFWPTEAVCQLSLLANVFNLFPGMGGSLYLAFLFSALVQTSWIFLELLDSVLDSSA